LKDSPQDELPALVYAQHWAETGGQPAPAARRRVTEQYGEETVEAIELALTVAGAGLIVFYLAKLRFFQQRRLARVLSVIGSRFQLDEVFAPYGL
jgi:hypothetical protein